MSLRCLFTMCILLWPHSLLRNRRAAFQGHLVDLSMIDSDAWRNFICIELLIVMAYCVRRLKLWSRDLRYFSRRYITTAKNLHGKFLSSIYNRHTPPCAQRSFASFSRHCFCEKQHVYSDARLANAISHWQQQSLVVNNWNYIETDRRLTLTVGEI